MKFVIKRVGAAVGRPPIRVGVVLDETLGAERAEVEYLWFGVDTIEHAAEMVAFIAELERADVTLFGVWGRAAINQLSELLDDYFEGNYGLTYIELGGLPPM